MEAPLLKFPDPVPPGGDPPAVAGVLERLDALQHSVEHVTRWVEAQQALACMPPARSWRGRLKGLLGLRLGSLMQYRSRPLTFPAWYTAGPLPDRPPVISV